MNRRKDFYLGQLRTEEVPIFCYVNPVGQKLILYFSFKREFDKKADMAIREFLIEANRQLAVAVMNPLYKEKTVIKSAVFEERMLGLGKNYLRQLLDHRK